MKIYFIFFNIILVAMPCFAQDSDLSTPEIFRYGVSTAAFEGLNHNDTAAALKAWSNAILSEQGLNVSAELHLYDNFNDLRKAFTEDKVEAITLNVEEFLRLNINPDFIYLPTLAHGLFINYAVIVNSQSSIDSPAALRKHKIVSHNVPRMIWAKPWLKTLISKDTGSKQLPTDLKIVNEENPSKAVFQVYFNQADAALLPTETFVLACELNPQLRKDLTILSVSPPLITSVVVFRPSYRSKVREKLENFLVEMYNSTHGRQVLTTFKSSKMERHPVSILQGTVDFLKEYNSLKNMTRPQQEAK